MAQRAAELLRDLATVPLDGAVADVELTQTVQCLQAVVRIAEARTYAVVAEIEQRHAARGQSAASTEDLLTRTLQLTPGEARARTELAAGLALVPDTAKALADGRMGVGQAAVTVKKATEVADRDDAAELLATIDRTASTVGQTLNRTRLAREIDTAVARTGADVLAQRERAAFARRKVEWDVRDGMTVLRAELPPAGGAIVRAALDALSRPSEGDSRKCPQRQADALVALAEQALKDPDGLREVGGVATQVLLVTSPEALHDVPGADPSLLDGYGPVSSDLARQLCCEATVTLVTKDPDTGRIDASDQHRNPTPRQRAAVIARDQACVGCAAPVSRCQIHHIIWRSRGGPTLIDNLVLVCWNCHSNIHHMGWRVTRGPDGRYKAGPSPAAPPEPTGDPPDASPHLENFIETCLLYTSPSPRDRTRSRMPSSA